MIQKEIMWIKNRRAFLIILGTISIVFICVFIFSGFIPLIFIDTAKALSFLPILIFLCVFIGILTIPLWRIIPIRVGFSRTLIIFKGPLSLRGSIVKVSDIVQIRYYASRGTLRKPLKKRVQVIEIGFGYHSSMRRLCDGPVIAQMMKTIPRDQSKLIVATSGGKTEERAISESDWI